MDWLYRIQASEEDTSASDRETHRLMIISSISFRMAENHSARSGTTRLSCTTESQFPLQNLSRERNSLQTEHEVSHLLAETEDLHSGFLGSSMPTQEQDEGTDVASVIMHSSSTTKNEQSTVEPGQPQSYSLIPTLPPDGVPVLNWRSFTLKTRFLLCNALLCFAITGAIFAILYGTGNDRQAVLTNENAHIISSYTPTLIATINWLTYRSVLFELLRMLPYYRMADQKGRITTGATARQSVAGFYHPFPLLALGDDRRVKVTLQIVVLVGLFLTSFKSVLLGSQRTADGWMITIHPIPAYYLMVVYTLMGSSYVFITIWVHGKSTGLKWDPASPLDQLALIMTTNAMVDISRLPLHGGRAYDVLQEDVRWRIGYWWRVHKDTNGQEIHPLYPVYGIGMLSIQDNGRPAELVLPVDDSESPSCREDGICTCDKAGACNFTTRLYPANSRPAWFGFIGTILLVGTVMLVFCAARGGLGPGIMLTGKWIMEENDISPVLFAAISGDPVKADDSTTANILFRALPTFLAQLCTAYVGGFATRLQSTQCWSDLAARPLPSDKSLALDYSTMAGFLVPFAAMKNEHYRLATVTTICSLAPLFVVFVAGLFTFERQAVDALLVSYAKPAFMMVCIYLIAFIVAVILAWPRRMELLLRPMFSIADFVRPFTGSRLLQDSVIHEGSRLASQEKFRARVLIAEHMYQLGVIDGTCGHKHVGVDAIGGEGGARYEGVGIKAARQLIDAQRMHRRGFKEKWEDPYGVDQGGQAAVVAVPNPPDE